MIDNRIYKNPFFVAAMAALCCALWGSATPFIKIGYKLMLPVNNPQSAILFAGTRFFLAGIITVCFYSIVKRRFMYPKAQNITKVVKISCFQTILQYIFFYIGLSNTTGVKGTILSGSNAFFALLIASLIFKQEKLTIKKISGCIIGFVGIVLVNLNGLDLNMNFTGDGFVLISTIAYAVSSTLTGRYSKHEDPVVLSGYQFVLGGLVMIIIGIIFGGKIQILDMKSVLVFLYLACLSAVAYGVWSILLKHNRVSKVTVYSFLIPVFGVVLSNIMLTEKSNVHPVNLLAALLLICTGIFILNKNKE